jgi:hypothetical protein
LSAHLPCSNGQLSEWIQLHDQPPSTTATDSIDGHASNQSDSR